MLNIVEINHVSIWVKSVPESVNFYANVLEMRQLHIRPNFDFEGAWFAIGERQQLHILEGRNDEVSHSSSRRNHFALQVRSIEEAEDFLKTKNIAYKGPKARPDGVMQIFIQDPDGYWIEFTEL
ncbi:MAG: VOC family protein [Cytophagales bacterium]